MSRATVQPQRPLDRRMRSVLLEIFFAVVAVAAGAQMSVVCDGDCNGDNTVAINELITGVNIALGNQEVSTCSAFDANAGGSVAINELIAGVNNALNGCA